MLRDASLETFPSPANNAKAAESHSINDSQTAQRMGLTQNRPSADKMQ
jgi:hypothetical protein